MFIFYIALFTWPFLAPGIWSFVIGQIVLAAIVTADQDQYTNEASFLGWLVGSLVPFMIVFAILLGTYPINKPITETRIVEKEKIDILSLTNEASIGGSFVLGTGSISTSPAYMSKRITTDGGFETFMVDGKTTVYEDAPAADKASLAVYDVQKRSSRKILPDWVLYLIREEKVGPWETAFGEEFNKIHVPKGTVTKIFQI
jgi:hypothetical protein